MKIKFFQKKRCKRSDKKDTFIAKPMKKSRPVIMGVLKGLRVIYHRARSSNAEFFSASAQVFQYQKCQIRLIWLNLHFACRHNLFHSRLSSAAVSGFERISKEKVKVKTSVDGEVDGKGYRLKLT